MNAVKPVIYMADDDPDDRYMLRHALQAADPSLTILEAENGVDLMKLLTTWSVTAMRHPLLIVIDMNMPQMNGMEALVAIKANPALRHIPAVMLSTSADPDTVKLAYQNGVNSYVQKPVSPLAMQQIAQAMQVCFLDTATV